MKKTIFLAIILLCGMASPLFSMNKHLNPVKETKTTNFTMVIINANVKVKLLDSNDEVRMSGDSFFMQHVTIRQDGAVLIIDAVKNKNFKRKGIVYIPARTVRQIQVNNAALVESATSLQIPNLDILVNGDCRVHIVNKGYVKIRGSNFFDVDYIIKESLPQNHIML